MAAQGGDKLPIASIPEFDTIVETGRGYEGGVRRKGNVVYLFLVAEEAGNGLAGGGGGG